MELLVLKIYPSMEISRRKFFSFDVSRLPVCLTLVASNKCIPALQVGVNRIKDMEL